MTRKSKAATNDKTKHTNLSCLETTLQLYYTLPVKCYLKYLLLILVKAKGCLHDTTPYKQI